MKDLYFLPSEFNISGQPIPEEVADKIFKFHIWPLNEVRYAYAKPISISKRSGYRNFDWELAHGRNGRSEHTFIDKGACDIVGEDMKLLVHMVATMTEYCRICYYARHNFFHLDYKDNVRRYFIDYGYGLGWQSVKNLNELILLIK